MTEPYPTAPPPDAASLGYRSVETATQTVGGSYREEMESAARAGVTVRGTRRNDGAFVFPGTEYVNPAEVFRGPGYIAPTPPRAKLANLSVVLAALNIVIVPMLTIGFGFLGLLWIASSIVPALVARTQTADGRTAGRGAAMAGLTLSIIVGGLTLLGLMISFIL